MKPQTNNLLNSDIKVINIGLQLFAESLSAQSVNVVHVAWNPPVELESDLKRILDDLL